MSHPPVRPRQLRHRGVVDAHGYLLSAVLLGEQVQLERALELYAAGARVLQLDGATWLVCLSRPTRVHSDGCRGAPLTRLGPGHLAAAPLSAAELAGVFELAGPSVLWLQRGQLMQTPLARCAEVDLAARIELPALQVLALAALTDPPRPIEVDERPRARSLRDVLGDRVPPPSDAQQAMMRSLAERSGKGQRARAAGAGVASAVSTAAGAVRSLLQRLRRVASGTARPARRAPRNAPAARSQSAAVPSPLLKLWSALERRLRMLALRSPLGSLLSYRQSRYVQKMLELFEERDLREALRHAIPLAPPGGTGEPGQPALGVPEPRNDLSLRHAHRAGGGSAFSSDSLYAYLQRVYRAAAERLEQEGKLHEAAFVYAELLQDVSAAVQMLERAGAFAAAAELAEGRKLEPGLIVRLWFLAKQVDRAIAYAVEHEAFADAIRRLQVHDVHAANALRLMWAERLAAAGRYAAAVDVLWPFEDARHIALEWLERVTALGGLPGARALARAIRLGRSQPAVLEPAYRALLADTGYDSAHARMELASCLLEAGAMDNERTGRYLPALLRDVLNDAAHGYVRLERGLRRGFERSTSDKALLADIPADVRPSAAPRAPVIELEWKREDEGSLELRGAVRLASGSYALALGEGGILVLNARGKARSRLSLPTDRLIMSDNGLVAISVKHRDHLVRLGHVDFVRGSAEPWADTELHAYARDHDGERWFVRRDDELMCLDLLRTDLHAAWRVRDPDFLFTTVQRDAKQLLAVSSRTPSVWRYELPSSTLRRRTEHEPVISHGQTVMSWAFGMSERIVRVATEREGEAPCRFIEAHGSRLPLLDGRQFVLRELIATDDHAVAVCSTEADTIVEVFTHAPLGRVFRCTARGHVRISASVTADRLLLADDRGRLLDYDLRKQQVVHDLRLHV